MKITLYEFNALPDQEQYHIIFSQGVYLESRYDAENRHNFYAVDMFFAEVAYNANLDKIIAKKSLYQGNF